MIQEFKSEMLTAFEMTDLGEMSYFLGMEISQSQKGIFICQRKYAYEILKIFSMENSKPIGTPLCQILKLCKDDKSDKVDVGIYRSLIGCLLYLTSTRLDLTFAASLLSRFMNSPSVTHFQAAKRVLRYLRGSMDHGIMFKKVDKMELIGYTDSYWVGSIDDMRSTYGFFLYNWVCPGLSRYCVMESGCVASLYYARLRNLKWA
ncbi:hypothetical protein GH714_030871 [Hevea brasiliensis]|uniref:Reverse transcriptase Ty1/copia-type domain-containing protein n=1 Tax=Hevea brasiliensis TaxID=3981 RepID=A0A6A6LKM2_HEVBR|nr:hypothetical protein GH714_030871 [Hevea brasiliensis]